MRLTIVATVVHSSAAIPVATAAHHRTGSCTPTTSLLLHPSAINQTLCPGAPAFGPYCGAVLVPGVPTKDSRNPLFTEGTTAYDAFYDDGYPNVLFDEQDGKYKVWHVSYQGTCPAAPSGANCSLSAEGYTAMLNYRESTDGIHWPLRPLGIVPFNNSTKNNIVMGYAGAVGVTLDESSVECRFRALGTTAGKLQPAPGSCSGPCPSPICNHAYGASWCSPDGKHWSPPVCTNGTLGSRWDTHNNFFRPWRGSPWVVFSRSTNWTFGRQESRGTTENFVDFAPAGSAGPLGDVVLRDSDAHEIYAMVAFSAAEASGRERYSLNERHLFLGMTAIFNEDVPGGATVDCELSMSTDTVRWTRVFPGTAFIPRGPEGSYDGALNFCGARPFAKNGSLQIYYMGNRNRHNSREEWPPFGSHPGGSLDLARLRLDGWAGYTPCWTRPDTGCPGLHCGWPCPDSVRIATTAFLLSGNKLHVNLEMRLGAVGLRTELRHAVSGEAVPGFRLNESDLVATDGHDEPVSWSSGQVSQLPGELLGHEVVLVFELLGAAVLYSYELACE